jgi:LPXTG-site transpeptidase (sortase) family protein
MKLSSYMFKKKSQIVVSVILVIVIWLGTLTWLLYNYNQKNTQTQNIAIDSLKDQPNIDTPKEIQIENPTPQNPMVVNLGNNFLKEVSQATSQNISDNKNPDTKSKEVANKQEKPINIKNSSIPIRLPTNEDVPTSDKTGDSNTLDFGTIGIQAPIVYASLGDIFEKNADGTINTNKPIQEDLSKGPLSTPVQRLLTKGIVHLPFTPNPGELGNSYIVGHSSNYSSVKSVYNYVFKNLGKAKIGDEFTIFNNSGKGLIFKVFEKLEVNTADVDKAYQDFGSRRVVTLQASILVNGKPLKRLLVRGELTN